VLVPKGEKTGIGSGCVIDLHRKWVLTNEHVVEGASTVLVVFPRYENGAVIADPKRYKGAAIQARVVASDFRRDLAILELESIPSGVKQISLADRSPKPGQTLHTIGNSGGDIGLLWRYIPGKVRQVGVTTRTTGRCVGVRLVENTSSWNPGDSGGPVVDDRGVLVGLVSFGLDGNQLNYAIDIQEIRSFQADARSGKSPAVEVGDLTGVWSGPVKDAKGNKRVLRLEFTEGNRVHWLLSEASGAVVKDKKGGYSVEKGRLKLNFGDKDASEGAVVRRDANRFTFTYRGNPLHFERSGSTTADRSAPKQDWLIGVWAAKVKESDDKVDLFVLILGADGRYTLAIGPSLEEAKGVEGKYTFADGTLTLTADNGKKLVGRVTRLDADSMTVAVDGDEPLTFERVKGK
jgi:S1-C subfamily serine protease